MLSNEEKSRYSKQIILPEIGTGGQERLRAAKVLVIGAGGLGCPVLQYLTAAGVGTIGIADGDIINISNLQRQVLYTEQETGLYSALHLRVVGVSVVELGGQCRPASVGIRACRLRKRSEAECSASVGLGGVGWGWVGRVGYEQRR